MNPKKIAIALGLVGAAFLCASISMAIEIRASPSCGTWVKERSEKAWQVVVSQFWVLGYLSGMALGEERDTLKGYDNDSIFLWMDNYCRENPLKQLSHGGLTLHYELVRQKGLR